MLRLTVLAHPGARQELVQLLEDDSLSIHVRARAIEGRANVAIETALARTLGLRARQVTLVGGQHSRRKIVELDLPDVAALRERLMAHRVRSP